MKKLKTITSILLIQTILTSSFATAMPLQAQKAKQSMLSPQVCLGAKSFQKACYYLYETSALENNLKAKTISVQDISALLEQIQELGSENRIINHGEQTIRLWDFFQKKIVPIENKNELIDKILEEISQAELHSPAQKNLVETLGLLFSEKYLNTKERLSITQEQYYELWNMYDLAYEFDGMLIKDIAAVLYDEKITIIGDADKRKTRDFAKKEFIKFLNWAFEKHNEGAPIESLDISSWISFLVSSSDAQFIDIALEIMDKSGKDSASYGVILYGFLVPLLPHSKYIREKINILTNLEVKPFIQENIRNAGMAWSAIFENEVNEKKFLKLATHLRKIYPYTISKNDPRPPFQYAQEEGIIFQIGKNLFITPVTESFRRHLIFGKDERGNILFSFEVMIPGEDIDRRKVEAKKRYDIAFKILDKSPGACVAPLFYKQLTGGEYELYGEKVKSPQEDTWNIIAFDYAEDGKRLANITSEILNAAANKLNISRKKIDKIIAREVAEIIFEIHKSGYVGFNNNGGKMYYDNHIENLRFSITDGEIKIKLVGDFVSFTKLEGYSDAEKEMRIDQGVIIEGIDGIRPGNLPMPGLKDRLTTLTQDELYEIFREVFLIESTNIYKVFYHNKVVLIERAI